MSSQLMKAVKVSLTNCTTAASTVDGKLAAVPGQSTVVSWSSTAVQPTVVLQSSAAVKQKLTDTASSALNKTFEKEQTCNS